MLNAEGFPVSPTPTKFVCPKCKSEYFGTSKFNKALNSNPEIAALNMMEGDSYGHCNARSYGISDCTFKWVRNKYEDEKYWKPYDVQTGKVYPEIKFAPEHFPVGTIFEVRGNVVYSDDRSHFYKSMGVDRNGVRSFVIRTTDMKQWTSGGTHQTMYNIHHVVRIIKRGDGPTIVNYNGHPGWDTRVAEDYAKYVIDCQVLNVKHRLGLKAPRTHYTTWSFQTMLSYLISKQLSARRLGNVTIDGQRLGDALASQSFCTHIHKDDAWLHVWQAPKKRVDAWMNANIMRFLCDLDDERKKEEEEERKEYERSASEGWFDDEPVRPEELEFDAATNEELTESHGFDSDNGYAN